MQLQFCLLRGIPHFNDPSQAPDRFIRDDKTYWLGNGGNEAGRFATKPLQYHLSITLKKLFTLSLLIKFSTFT